MVTKVFIDSNVIVHWIILNKIQNQNRDNADLWKEFDNIKPSFDLLNKILECEDDRYRFYTSQLAMSEVFYGLYEEYRCRRMRKDGLPLSSWIKHQDKYLISPDDINDIRKEIQSFQKLFIHNKKRMRVVSETYASGIISTLVLSCGLRTHDAILLGTAISRNIDYFVTYDKRLSDKNLKSIKVIRPSFMNRLLIL